MIMARNEDGTYSQVGFVKDNNGVDTEYIYDKDGDKVFEKGFTREMSSTVPLQINGIGKDLKEWSITGNTVQDGTPTPENPVEVLGCGDKTENLFDESNTIYQPSLGVGIIGSNGVGNFVLHQDDRIGVFSVCCNPNTTYTIQSSNGNHIFVAYGNEEANDGVAYRGAISLEAKIATITTDDSAKYLYLYLVYVSDLNLGITVDLVKEKLQINLGSEPLPYEPYGYKIPIMTKGKNLFDYKTMYGSNCKYLSGNGEVLDDDKWAITDYIPCSGNIFTINPIGGNIPAICLYDSQKNFITGLAYETGSADYKKPVTIRSEINASYIRFSYFIQEYISKDDLSKIQLELGDKSTSYEPYHEPITTPIYLSEPLQAGEVLRSDGSRDVKWGVKVFDGTEAFKLSNSGLWLYTLKDDAEKNIIMKGWCNYASVSSWGQTPSESNFAIGNGSSRLIGFPVATYTDVDTIKSVFAQRYAEGNPVVVYYPLAEPTTETITVSQIPTFDGTTVIDVDTTVPPSNFYGKYKSSK